MSKYEIIDENDEYLVINKPARILAHGADHIKERSLVDEILKEYPKIRQIGEDPGRPGIMHRLDKLASGVMVIAKTQDSFDNLKKQFQKRTINKKYIALVHGKIDSDEGEINFPIQRSSKGHKMAALPLTENGEETQAGRRAITEFIIIKKFINYTLLEIKIKTGRTHQIRVHMSAYGHPVVGDSLYGTKKTKVKDKKLGIERLFLVASELQFTDLLGERKNYKIKLPEELKIILEKIK